jgi:c-di-GMP-related signal transduction protein
VFERFIARHAILRDNLTLLGYDLHFREADSNCPEKRAWSAAYLIDASTMVFHWESLTANNLTFVSLLTAEELQGGAALLLPRSKTVIELPPSVPCDPEVLSTCKALKSAGYRLALSGWLDQPERRPLAQFADFLRVDIRQLTWREASEITRPDPIGKATVIADGVETWEEHRTARKSGFHAFQGNFFLKPQLFRRRDVAGTQKNSLRLLQAILKSPLDQAQIEEILREEPALTYKLLRYLNSPVMERQVEVRSIRTAISLLGEQEFRRWASVVALVTPATDKASELLHTGLARAYFCEQLGFRRDAPRAYDYFFTGLFSVMDAVLDRPLPEIVAELALSDEVRKALQGGPNDLFEALQAAKSYEQGNWSSLKGAMDQLALPEGNAPDFFQSAENSVNAVLS